MKTSTKKACNTIATSFSRYENDRCLASVALKALHVGPLSTHPVEKPSVVMPKPVLRGNPPGSGARVSNESTMWKLRREHTASQEIPSEMSQSLLNKLRFSGGVCSRSLYLSISLSLYLSTPLSIYIYVVESKLGPKIALFCVKNLVQIFSVFLFFKIVFFLQGEWDLKKNEQKQKQQKKHFFESKLGPILLRNILGPRFDSTLDQVLTQHFC